VRPVRPVLTALRETLALPASLVGPVEDWALRRLALICAGEDIWETPCFGFSFLEIKKRPGTTAGQGTFLMLRYGRVNSPRKR